MCTYLRKCTSSSKHVILLFFSSCYCFEARGNVSLVPLPLRVSSHLCGTLGELRRAASRLLFLDFGLFCLTVAV